MEGDETFDDVREHEIQVDQELEQLRSSHNSLVKSERTMEADFNAMRQKVQDQGGANNWPSSHQYGHLVFYMAIHAIEALERKYEDLVQPIFSTIEMRELETRFNNEISEGAILPKVYFLNLLKFVDKEITVNTNSMVEIIYHLPVVFKDEYMALRILAAPKLDNGTMLKVPEADIAINDKTQQFFYLTPDIEILKLSDQIVIAKTNTIRTFKAAENDCIANAVLRHQSQPSDCEMITISNDTTRVVSITRQRFLFWTIASFVGYMVCPSSRTKIEAKIGMINLE